MSAAAAFQGDSTLQPITCHNIFLRRACQVRSSVRVETIVSWMFVVLDIANIARRGRKSWEAGCLLSR